MEPEKERDFARTPEALEIAGSEYPVWNNGVARAGLFAPDTVPGQARVFTVDDILITRIFQAFLDVGAKPMWAARIATAARMALEQYDDPERLSFWKIRGKGGKPDMQVGPAAPAGADVVFEVPLEKWRADIRRQLRKKYKAEK
jgi:hypothetical protein